RQHDAGALEVRHDAPDHGHDDTVDLYDGEADGGEDGEVDAQVAQAVIELVPAIGRFQLTVEPQSMKSASKLFRQRGFIRSVQIAAPRLRPAIRQYSAPQTPRTASHRAPRPSAVPRAIAQPPRAVPRAAPDSAGRARGN